jgi:hypothetical protein
MAANIQPIGEELRREANLGRARSIERRKRAQEQTDAVSGLSQAPSVASGMEQFQELRKGDIGEDAPSTMEPGGEEDYGEEPADEMGQPSGGEGGEGGENEDQQEQTGGPEQGQQSSGGRTGTTTAAQNRTIKKIQATIKKLQKDERPMKIQRNKDRAALYGLNAQYALSKAMDVIVWVMRWVRIVIGSWATIILGIILTLLSIVVIPIIIILATVGVFPPSPRTYELKARINSINRKIAQQNKDIANKENQIKSNYRNIFTIRQNILNKNNLLKKLI